MDGQLIGGDGVGYYVYVRSLVLDHDLDFTNDYAHYLNASQIPQPTPLHRPGNKYAVGPALLWTPFFLLAHVLALLGSRIGLPVHPDGYGYLYQAAISIGSIVYGSAGLFLAYRCARSMFSTQSLLTALVLLWLGSNVPYYMIFEPSLSHMVSMFSVSVLLTVWFLKFWRTTAPSVWSAALLGLASGGVLLVRLQDAPFLLLPILHLSWRFVQSLRQRTGHAWHWLRCGLVAALGGLIAFAPQLLVWKHVYGAWMILPYLQDHDPPFYWRTPQIFSVLFSTFHGLFLWHPIYFLALIGVLYLRKSRPRFALVLLSLLAADVYLVGAWCMWWQGDAFGGRMFLNAIWIWLFGLAAFVGWWNGPGCVRPRTAWLAGLVIGWNVLSLVQYRLGFVPMGKPLTWEQMTLGRIEVPWLILQKLLH
jgi:MFS family permease